MFILCPRLLPILSCPLKMQKWCIPFCPQSSDLFSLLQTQSLFLFSSSPLEGQFFRECSRVANMKHIFHWGRRLIRLSVLSSNNLTRPVQSSGCCSVLKKCVWVGDPVTPEGSCVCVCVFQHACLQKHAMGKVLYDWRLFDSKDEVGLFFWNRNMWLLFISFSQTHFFWLLNIFVYWLGSYLI